MGAPTDCRRSIDCRSVVWHGADYVFTETQAAIIALLWNAWENGTPEIGRFALLDGARVRGERVDSIFKRHPAWGVMLGPGSTKGSYRLFSCDAAMPHLRTKAAG